MLLAFITQRRHVNDVTALPLKVSNMLGLAREPLPQKNFFLSLKDICIFFRGNQWHQVDIFHPQNGTTAEGHDNAV